MRCGHSGLADEQPKSCLAKLVLNRLAEYFATSLAIENVVSAPRVISNCLPMATISISFVGLLSRSTMLPASFAAIVPVFMATPTSAVTSRKPASPRLGLGFVNDIERRFGGSTESREAR